MCVLMGKGESLQVLKQDTNFLTRLLEAATNVSPARRGRQGRGRLGGVTGP